MNVSELSELYQKALKVQDEAIRNTLAQAVAEAATAKAMLSAAQHRDGEKHRATLAGALASRAIAEVETLEIAGNALLAGRDDAAAEATTTEAIAAEAIAAEAIAAEALSAEAIGAEPTVAEPLAAEPLAAEPFAAEPLAAEPISAEPLVAEPFVAEPFVAEPFVAEPMTPVNVKAGSGQG